MELTREYNLNRNYLKADEIRYIGETMLAFDNYIDREICKMLLIVDYLTDIDINIEKDENGDDILTLTSTQYDELYECGVIDDIADRVDNIDMIELYVLDKESIYNIINNIAKDLTESLNNVESNFTVDKLVKELNKISELSEVTKSKEVIDDGK